MNEYLLDTHSFLWAIFEPEKLGEKTMAILKNPHNTIYVSSITFWEISLKYASGKLELTCTPEKLIQTAYKMGLKTIALSIEEAALFYQLPKLLHKDPFDRMLIWQAISHHLIFISKDNQFENYQEYGLKIVW